MKKPLLQSSNNSKIFVANHEQRPLNPQHIKFLMSSMRQHGFFASKPIQCYKDNSGSLVVVDGHHRLAAAKALEETFYYVIEDQTSQEAMPQVNRSLSWKLEDFIRQYKLRGNRNYEVLSAYVDRGLSAGIASALLSGNAAASFNQGDKIRSGQFIVKSTKHAEDILSMSEDNPTIKVFRHSGFIKALSLCLWIKEFDFATFKSRSELNYHMIPNCSNVDDFLRAIEEVFNYRNHKKLPLAHMAKLAAKQRALSK